MAARILFLLLLPFSFVFSLSRLPPAAGAAANITFFGDAAWRNDGISLTHDWPASTGRAVFGRPLRFLDPVTNSPASFATSFSFSILPATSSSFGDGFAFFVSSYGPAFSPSLAGYLAIIGTSAPPPAVAAAAAGQDTIVAVEFDTAFNLDLGDINDNHIGVDINTIFSFVSQDAAAAGVNLRAGRPITAWVEYKNDDKTFQVWASYSGAKPADPLLATHLDLSRHLAEFMYVGFSAANGGGAALHLIDRWTFRTFASGTDNTHSIIGGGGGGGSGDGGEKEVSGAAAGTPPPAFADPTSKKPKRAAETALGAIVGGAAAAAVFSVAGLGVAGFLHLRKRKKTKPYAGEAEAAKVPSRLSFAEVKQATNGFHGSRVLGKGGSGTVYKGVLSSGQAVAVKRFTPGPGERVSDTFVTELSAMVASLRHKNLVQLKGWCCEKGELLLVYEHMPNSSLDKALHGRQSSPPRSPLRWEARVRILLGAASALAFLHEECEKQIIHRDVKSSNILLDADMNAKLGDLGMAEIYDHSRNAFPPPPTIPAGTMGYLAPEYVHSGVPTVKTDVYGFGVVVLEVATGRRPIETSVPVVLMDWVWELWGAKRVAEAADPALQGKFDLVGMERVLTVGLACAHPDHRRRPSMKAAIRMLKAETPPPKLQEKKPPVSLWMSEPGTEASASAGSVTTRWATPCQSLPKSP